MADDTEDTLTRKEQLRVARRAAYQRAKAARATDPRFLALKQAAKEQRRAAYQREKERRKEQGAKAKRQQKAQAEVTRGEERAQADAKLLELLWVGKGSSARN